ncbi:MAG: hypothetical protein RL385_4296 [Pseudomonadota bacterium]|jgi:hypothetical protein
MPIDPRPSADALATPIGDERLQYNLQGVRTRQERLRVRRAQLRASAVTALLLLGAVAIRQTAMYGPQQVAPALVAQGSGLERLGEPPVSAPAEEVRLADGSRIFAGRGAHVSVAEQSKVRTRSVLHGGWARYEVTPGLARAFEVEAGPLTVLVVGTGFTVARHGDAARVKVHHGRVLVKSSLLPEGGVELGAGEDVNVERIPAQAAESPVADLPAVALPHPPERIAQRVTPSSLHTILARADALRMQKRWKAAAALLRSALTPASRDPDMGLLLLTLAQLELDSLDAPGLAAKHFDEAVASASLPPALQEHAMALSAQAYARAGAKAEADRRAEAYRTAYPRGRYLGLIRGALGQGPSTSP